MSANPASHLFKRSRHLLRPSPSHLPIPNPHPRKQWIPSSRFVTILAPGPSPESGMIVEKDARTQSERDRANGGGTTGIDGGGDVYAAGNGVTGDTPLDRIINAMPSTSDANSNPSNFTSSSSSSQHPFASIPSPLSSTPTNSNIDTTTSPFSDLPTTIPRSFIRPPSPLHPFDTHAFVRHMEKSEFSLGASRTLMRATEGMIVGRSGKASGECLHKEDIENAAYLFAAALSELRTELSVRARNDGLALRSTSSLIRREVDALSQKLKEDIGTLKHDIEMDMNNRKAETRTEQKGYDIAIEEINNKFTISIGDLKTEIEQAKWDATRRAITIIAAVVFACITIITLSGDKASAPKPPTSTPPIPQAVHAQMRDIGVETDRTTGDEDDDAALLSRLEGLAALGRERAAAAAAAASAGGENRNGGAGSGMQSSGFAVGDDRFAAEDRDLRRIV